MGRRRSKRWALVYFSLFLCLVPFPLIGSPQVNLQEKAIKEILAKQEEVLQLFFSNLDSVTGLSHSLLVCPTCRMNERDGQSDTLFNWMFKKRVFPSGILYLSHRDWLLDSAANLHLPLHEKILFKNEKQYTIKQLLERSLKEQLLLLPLEQVEKFSGPELGFSLAAYAYYIKDFTKKQPRRGGEPLSVEDLIQIAISRPIDEFTECGSHELIGIASVLEQYKKRDPHVNGIWEKTDQLLASKLSTVKKQQQKNGSLGCIGSKHYQRLAKKKYTLKTYELNYTAHNLLWILRYIPATELEKEWIQKAVAFLVERIQKLLNHGDNLKSIGMSEKEKAMLDTPIAHSYEALHLYMEKKYQ